MLPSKAQDEEVKSKVKKNSGLAKIWTCPEEILQSSPQTEVAYFDRNLNGCDRRNHSEHFLEWIKNGAVQTWQVRFTKGTSWAPRCHCEICSVFVAQRQTLKHREKHATCLLFSNEMWSERSWAVASLTNLLPLGRARGAGLVSNSLCFVRHVLLTFWMCHFKRSQMLLP